MLELRDPVSSASHFLTFFWAVFVTLILWRLTRYDRTRRMSVTVFGIGMMSVYFFSGLFHGLRLPREDLRVYQQLDQSAIYVLIAGTYTPVMAVLLTGCRRRVMLIGIWTMAFVGIACMWMLPKVPHTVTVGLYLGMGWFGMLGIWHYYQAIGWRGMTWAMTGAFFYTLGAVFELLQWPVIWEGVIRGHEMLHFCDIIATYCHVVFIMRYVITYRPQAVLANLSNEKGYIRRSDAA